MSLQVLSLFWGKQHADMFKEVTVRSLSFPRNRGALVNADATWNIFTNEEFFEDIEAEIAKQIPWIKRKLRPVEMLRRYVDQTQSALVWQIEECLKEKARFLFAPPDTLFADGTVAGLLKIGEEPGACVAIAHPRVLPDILLEDDFKQNKSLTPEKLVSLTWKHLHQSWSDAEVGHARYNGYVGGVYWRRIRPETDLFSVCHRLPTVYLADFTGSDLQYFQTISSFGSYDHEWPGHMLIPQGRYRFVGSSDAGFICEITEKFKNHPPVKEGPEHGFWRSNPHNHFNRQVSVIFRGNG